jgi:hypothetical protein
MQCGIAEQVERTERQQAFDSLDAVEGGVEDRGLAWNTSDKGAR